MEYLPRYNQFVSDTLSALVASFCVAPFITVVDKSIMQNASGAKPLRPAIIDGFTEVFTKPHRFVRRPEFLMIWGLYYVTYQTAHTISSICENKRMSPVMPKFVGTTTINSIACIAKDREFTRMFGVKAPTGLPWSTYGLFFLRDCITIFASFSLPPVLAEKLVKEYNIPNEAAQTMAQLSCPVGVQVFSTPPHLLGLNMYNVPDASLATRLKTVGKQYIGSTIARAGKIFPAFGIGGELSRRFRNALRERTGVLADIAALNATPKKLV